MYIVYIQNAHFLILSYMSIMNAVSVAIHSKLAHGQDESRKNHRLSARDQTAFISSFDNWENIIMMIIIESNNNINIIYIYVCVMSLQKTIQNPFIKLSAGSLLSARWHSIAGCRIPFRCTQTEYIYDVTNVLKINLFAHFAIR